MPAEDSYLLAVLNSQLANFYLASTSATYRGGYLRLKGQYVEEFPICQVAFRMAKTEREVAVNEIVEAYEAVIGKSATGENHEETSILELVETHLAAEPERTEVVHDLLTELAERMNDFIAERAPLNLSILDYLGNYSDGQTLSKFYQPPSGLAESILTDTTEDHENLKIEMWNSGSHSFCLSVLFFGNNENEWIGTCFVKYR